MRWKQYNCARIGCSNIWFNKPNTTKPNKRYCSARCRLRDWRLKHYQPTYRPCDRCGHSFELRKAYQRYCSPACRQAAWRASHPGRVDRRRVGVWSGRGKEPELPKRTLGDSWIPIFDIEVEEEPEEDHDRDLVDRNPSFGVWAGRGREE